MHAMWKSPFGRETDLAVPMRRVPSASQFKYVFARVVDHPQTESLALSRNPWYLKRKEHRVLW
jgi:hypothetical protein